MNELLQDFLSETQESLDRVDVELVRFEREPNNAPILANIFRLVHTIKGTCGFLGLPRLEALTHAAESLMGRFRDGMPVTADAVSLTLSVIDRIKEILTGLETNQAEPPGDDEDLIGALEKMSKEAGAGAAGGSPPTTALQTLERPLRPDEVPLDELERAFRDAPGMDASEAREFAGAEEALSDDDRRAGERRENERREIAARHQTLRVQVDTLERLMTMVSELVLTRNQLAEVLRRDENSELKAPFQRLSNITLELQEGVMKTRMQPIGNAWAKLPRLLRDLSAELGKKIEIEMHGEDTELDRQLLDIVRDPLTHMVRNAADHGIETPEERRAAGKPETGKIRLSATHEGGHIIVEIGDDGRGLDVARIRTHAVWQGLVSEPEAEKLSEAQLYRFLFAPGFSTAARVTSVSGRGVGMDVVKSNIDQIGGTIDVKSVSGRGTTFRIKIPLTLAIIPALIVEAGGERFAIPQIAVAELVRAGSDTEHRIERLKDASVMRLWGKLLPVVGLESLLRTGAVGEGAAEPFVVVMQAGTRRFGIAVDKLLHTEEIVVKPMSRLLNGIRVFSGNTILGDGSVIMILDPNGMADAIGANAEMHATHDESIETAQVDDSDAPVSLLVFRAGSAELKAVPVALVTRLEQIEAHRIEFSNGRHVVQYRGGLMPLVPVSAATRICTEGTQPILVFIDADRSMGLVVDEIVDIVEDRLDIKLGSANPGVLGSAVVNGQVAEILDIGHYLPLAYEDWLHRSEISHETVTRRILLIDDSAFFRNMLTPVLKAAGYAVRTAAGAAEALELLERDVAFDFVVSDILMPGMDGFEFAERVRADPRTASLRLFALTSLLTPAQVERGRQAGFTELVAKFDRGGLIALLQQPHARLARAA